MKPLLKRSTTTRARMTDSLFVTDFDPAIFSPCRRWRYRLERRWSAGARCAFILLNPSTADESSDDPTIRKCKAYAKRWGYGGLILGNLFAWRSTDPAALRTLPDPIGPDNDRHLLSIASEVDRVVCGWGTHGAFMARETAVLEMLTRAGAMPLALHRTADGHPGHPLYLRADAEPLPL